MLVPHVITAVANDAQRLRSPITVNDTADGHD